MKGLNDENVDPGMDIPPDRNGVCTDPICGGGENGMRAADEST